jgi:hypothetical protein
LIVDFSFGFQRGRQYVLGMTQFKLIADPVEGIFLSFLFSTDVCIEVQGPVGPQRDLGREGPRRSSSAARSGRFVLRQPAATSSWDLSVIESSHVLSAAICWSCFPGPSFFFSPPACTTGPCNSLRSSMPHALSCHLARLWFSNIRRRQLVPPSFPIGKITRKSHPKVIYFLPYVFLSVGLSSLLTKTEKTAVLYSLLSLPPLSNWYKQSD